VTGEIEVGSGRFSADGRRGTCGTLVIMDMETLQYPIGRFLWNVEADLDSRQAWLKAIEDTPAELQKVVSDLTEQQLDTPYRAGRLDGSSGGPPLCRRSSQLICAVQVGSHGGFSYNQGLRSDRLGGPH